ncbi:hypothetical protein LCGC14_0845650 [marine sediment metagenome]|uniref:Uncharacterized protein n=1 Tax=marine sediment metagenome TaxID=412755 RepID=A0A0F9PGQ6_9ZZZZ
MCRHRHAPFFIRCQPQDWPVLRLNPMLFLSNHSNLSTGSVAFARTQTVSHPAFTLRIHLLPCHDK